MAQGHHREEGQGDDQELECWMSEIKLRAIAQIAKLGRELEKNERARTDLPDTAVRQTTKEQQIRAAGRA